MGRGAGSAGRPALKGSVVDYAAVALKIIPPSCHRSVIDMRADIARQMQAAVDAALQQQRESKFPELAALRGDLEMRRKRLEQEKRGLDEREQGLVARETTLAAAERRLEAVAKALEAYYAWLDLDGDVSEGPARRKAMREALQTWQKERKP